MFSKVRSTNKSAWIVRGPLKELLPFIVNIEQLFVIFVTCIKIISKTTWPNLTKLGHNHNTRVSILKKSV